MSLRVCHLSREGTLDSGGKLVSCWYEESVLPVSGLCLMSLLVQRKESGMRPVRVPLPIRA